MSNSKDVPTPKKVQNLLSKLDISKLKIKNERELELVVWGILNGRWHDRMKYRKQFGGRVADIALDNIPVEIKYINSMSDKDRCVGQILDYLTGAVHVIVVAIDPKKYLKPISSMQNVTLVSL